MCGIAYAYNLHNQAVNDLVVNIYQQQRNRGTEGFGYFIPEALRLTHNTREGRILRRLQNDTASEVLFHHRLPTSTPNVRNSCHPFTTGDYFGNTQYVMVHNGWITNDYSLAINHEALGINYVSTYGNDNLQFNDSEALLYDLALTIEGRQPEPLARGAIAFVMVQMVNGERQALYFGRNYSSPLQMVHDDNGLILRSEGEGQTVAVNTLYRYDYATGELSQTPMTFGDYYGGTYTGYTSGFSYDSDSLEPEPLAGAGYNDVLDQVETYETMLDSDDLDNDYLEYVFEVEGLPGETSQTTRRLLEINGTVEMAINEAERQMDLITSRITDEIEAQYSNISEMPGELGRVYEKALREYSRLDKAVNELLEIDETRLNRKLIRLATGEAI